MHVTPSVSEGPGGAGGARGRSDRAAHPPRPLAHARGDHGRLSRAFASLTVNQIFYNLDSKLGTLFHASGSMEPSLYFTADKAEKVGDTRYILTQSLFTSCDLNRPSWSFLVARADVTLDDYAHMHDVRFRASRVPIFWAPSLVWPTKRDRSRGFLIPRLLISQEFG